jgi:signal transduction histidine kinase
MTTTTDFPQFSAVNPLRVFMLMMFAVFAVEGAIMVALPLFPDWAQSPLVEGLVDASLLTMVTAPVMWWLAVRPLKTLFEGRGQLLQQLFQVQERERARIARDLHDEIGQHLTALLVGLKTIDSSPTLDAAKDRAGQLRELASLAHCEVGRLARGLRPGVLEELHLEAAMERLCEEFQEMHNIPVRLTVEPGSCDALSTALETSLYRILQEALTNVARHANATGIEVLLKRGDNRVTLRVADDGRGFASHEADSGTMRTGRIGLASIRERALLLGGECKIQSERGTGTVVQVEIPSRV